MTCANQKDKSGSPRNRFERGGEDKVSGTVYRCCRIFLALSLSPFPVSVSDKANHRRDDPKIEQTTCEQNRNTKENAEHERWKEFLPIRYPA